MLIQGIYLGSGKRHGEKKEKGESGKNLVLFAYGRPKAKGIKNKVIMCGGLMVERQKRKEWIKGVTKTR